MQATVRPHASKLDNAIGARLERNAHRRSRIFKVVRVDAPKQVFIGKRLLRRPAEERLASIRGRQNPGRDVKLPGAETTSEKRRTQALLALIEFLHACSRFELPLTAFERGAGNANEGCGVE